jgi:hypothetical protein
MMTTDDDDYPRSMRDEGVRERRKEMLNEPHVADLTAYVAQLRGRGLGEVPTFDPLDGGKDARVLFLLEKPGSMAVESGFIGRNNDDPTAEAMFKFMHQACIPRKETVIWNVVPWWNGMVGIANTTELDAGAKEVTELRALLPNLRAVVMVGKRAAKAKPYFGNMGLKLFTSDHPGPRVRARWPKRWAAIPLEWAKAYAASLNGSESELCPFHKG